MLQTALHSQQIKFTTPIVASLLAFVLLTLKIKTGLLVAALVAFAAGTFLLKLNPGKGLQLYFVYLLFEGTIKIFTNYNPIFHVGSDILLLAVFARLIIRKTTTNEVDEVARDSYSAKKIIPFLMIFWMWVLVQFFNPWGIGLIPSIASFKIYVVPILLFFMVSFLMKDAEIRPLPYVILIVGIVGAAAGALDGALGDEFLPLSHPRYQQTLNGKFAGIFYRPFGTTALPGGPAGWMFHGLVAALIVCALEAKKKVLFKSNWFAPVLVYFVLAIVTLAFCQIRTAIIKFIGLAAMGIAFLSPKRSIQAVMVVIVLGLVGSSNLGIKIPLPSFVNLDRAEVLMQRFSSLGNKNTWSEARQGALGGMLELSEFTSMGIGLSRTGAATGPWQKQLKAEPFFGNRWAFSDNVYRAIFTEMGIFGLLSFIALFIAILWALFLEHNFISKIVFIYTALYLIAGFGSEGILYLPDSAFLWFYLAWALRFGDLKSDTSKDIVKGVALT